MKRKTNLFYIGQTQDNNFLSLSNYSESLTGNLLSTDNKIFPTSFICLYIPKLNEIISEDEYRKSYPNGESWDSLSELKKKKISFEYNKNLFIKHYMVAYYENKMATLRDWCIANNINQERRLLPLNYLLECISDYCLTSHNDDLNNYLVYYGEVTEQDYNGTYTDTICVVDPTNIIKPSIEGNNNNSKQALLPDESTDYLHGWSAKVPQYDKDYDFNKDGRITISLYKNDDNIILSNALKDWINVQDKYQFVNNDLSDDLNEYVRLCNKDKVQVNETMLKKIIDLAKYTEEYHGPEAYREVNPKYDGTTETAINNIKVPYYDITSYYKLLKLSKIEDMQSLKFNIVIPLYDIVDCNYISDDKKINEAETEISLKYDETSSESMVQHIPLGIWFSGANPVELEMDPESKCGTTWSLSIANQFKPFPVSDKMPSEITNDSKKDAFMTFARLLTMQTELVTKISDIMGDIKNISNRLTNVESAIGSVLTTYNLDTFRGEMNSFKEETNAKIEELSQRIKDLDLKWVNREG